MFPPRHATGTMPAARYPLRNRRCRSRRGVSTLRTTAPPIAGSVFRPAILGRSISCARSPGSARSASASRPHAFAALRCNRHSVGDCTTTSTAGSRYTRWTPRQYAELRNDASLTQLRAMRSAAPTADCLLPRRAESARRSACATSNHLDRDHVEPCRGSSPHPRVMAADNHGDVCQAREPDPLPDCSGTRASVWLSALPVWRPRVHRHSWTRLVGGEC